MTTTLSGSSMTWWRAGLPTVRSSPVIAHPHLRQPIGTMHDRHIGIVDELARRALMAGLAALLALGLLPGRSLGRRAAITPAAPFSLIAPSGLR